MGTPFQTHYRRYQLKNCSFIVIHSILWQSLVVFMYNALKKLEWTIFQKFPCSKQKTEELNFFLCGANRDTCPDSVRVGRIGTLIYPEGHVSAYVQWFKKKLLKFFLNNCPDSPLFLIFCHFSAQIWRNLNKNHEIYNFLSTILSPHYKKTISNSL